MKFDRIAGFYGLIEGLTTGSQMQRSRLEHLTKVNDAESVLIAGEGNGRFLAACAEIFPSARFTVVDESPKMLRLAQKRWEQAGGKMSHIEFIQNDLLTWKAKQDYDLIVTNFFLDCFPAEMVQQIIHKLTSTVAPSARWLLADFREPPGGLPRIAANVALSIAYQIFRQLAGVQARRLTNPDQLLEQAGFRLADRKLSCWGMMHSDLWMRN